MAARQFAILAACHLGADPVREPADLDAARARPGVHDLQLHDPAARGRAPHRVRAGAARSPSGCSGFSTRSRAASRPASSRAGTWITMPSLARTKTIRSGTTCRRRSTSAGTSSCIARPRCSRSISAPRGGSRRRIPTDLQRRIATERRVSIVAHLTALAAALVFLRVLRRAAHEHHPGVLHLPDRLHAEPARPALRHRSRRPGQVGHADAGPLVLGLRVPQLELPPRAPLLPRRAVLPSAARCSAR